MNVRITPGERLSGNATVPGDKSIAHRWLILAATAEGKSLLRGLPASLDVRSTAACLAAVAPAARPSLEAWAEKAASAAESHGSTWNPTATIAAAEPLEVEGEGLEDLHQPASDLDCGNSGTSMRLLMGLLAGSASTVRFVGDESLSGRPMDRVAEPLRLMGASVETTDAHAPVLVKGAKLKGIRYSTSTPSAQVKSSVLFAALSAEGETVLEEPAPTRDHTERALAALGAPVVSSPGRVGLRSFQHEGFEATVPGDPSSAAFLIAGAALTGSSMIITDLGLNPSRMHYLSVMERMGVRTTLHVERSELGEPVGTLHVEPATSLTGTSISGEELPLVIDEVPVLALMATHAEGETWFLGASELKVKESDRLRAIASGIWSLGGHAGDEGEDLVVSGLGLTGGRADAGGDHRMAMAFAVAALAADAPCEISGMEAAAVSFPGFIQTLEALGARIEVLEK